MHKFVFLTLFLCHSIWSDIDCNEIILRRTLGQLLHLHFSKKTRFISFSISRVPALYKMILCIVDAEWDTLLSCTIHKPTQWKNRMLLWTLCKGDWSLHRWNLKHQLTMLYNFHQMTLFSSHLPFWKQNRSIYFRRL